MNVSRAVLAVIAALSLSGVALAADEGAAAGGIERMPPGAESGTAAIAPVESALPDTSPAAASGPASAAAMPPAEDKPAPAMPPGEEDPASAAPGSSGQSAEAAAASADDESMARPAPAAGDDGAIVPTKDESAEAPASAAPEGEPAGSRI